MSKSGIRYIPVIEIVLTSNIDPYNYKKRIKFEKMGVTDVERYRGINPECVYTFQREW